CPFGGGILGVLSAFGGDTGKSVPLFRVILGSLHPLIGAEIGGCSHGVWGSPWRGVGQGPEVPPDPLPDLPPCSLLLGRALGVRAATGLHLCVPAEGAPTAHLAPVRAQRDLGSLPQ
ncbi:hypothetical protein Nmel_017980, partial [Mimus melanotis]